MSKISTFMAIALSANVLPLFRVPVEDEMKPVIMRDRDLVALGRDNPFWRDSKWKMVRQNGILTTFEFVGGAALDSIVTINHSIVAPIGCAMRPRKSARKI